MGMVLVFVVFFGLIVCSDFMKFKFVGSCVDGGNFD